MTQTAFMFPGVGSQYPGMGIDFYKQFKIFRDIFAEASEILSLDLKSICFEISNKDKLSQLENAQSSILTLSYALHKILESEANIKADFCLGYSLGEFSALACAGAIKFSDALLLVKERSRIINDVIQSKNGTMMWVINLDHDIVQSVCNENIEDNQKVYISAYDTPTQTSISGNKDLVLKVARQLEKKGGLIYPLKMAGPFHCVLMQKAALEMKDILKQFQYQSPLCRVIANCNALPYDGSKCVINNLSHQLMTPINWRQSINYLEKQGVKTAIEIGPKDILTYLLKKNTKNIRGFTFEKPGDLKSLIEKKELIC